MRRKPVKIWQILMCAALVVLVFVLFTLFQDSDSIAFQDGVFSQQAADSIRKNTGCEDVRVLSFTYNNNEKENFVLKVAAQKEGERTCIYQVQYYEGDSKMPYHMEKTDDTLDTYTQEPRVEDYFSILRRLRDQRRALFEIYSEEAKPAEGESFCQLDLRDCVHPDSILIRRVTRVIDLTESSASEPSGESASQEESDSSEGGGSPVLELVSGSAGDVQGMDLDFWRIQDGVYEQSGGDTEIGTNTVLLYRVSQEKDRMTEELIAVLDFGS